MSRILWSSRANSQVVRVLWAHVVLGASIGIFGLFAHVTQITTESQIAAEPKPGHAFIQTTVHSPALSPHWFWIDTTGCVHRLWVDTHEVQSPVLPLCTPNRALLNLGQYFEASETVVSAEVTYQQPHEPASNLVSIVREIRIDPLYLLPKLLLLISVLWYLWRMYRLL